MNVKPGGGQPIMHDTVYEDDNRFVGQRLVMDDGTPKGLKLVLEKRVFDTRGKTRKDLIMKLETYSNFSNELLIVEHYMKEHGHHCMFLPKFHCELNPIERVWGRQYVILEHTVIIQ